MRRRGLLIGAVLAALYMFAAVLTFEGGWLPARPLYDGMAPPEPYRFADPPPELEATNQPPVGADVTVAFEDGRFPGETAVTDDNQMFVGFDPDGFAPREGADGVRITIEPLDPDEFGDPPEGLGYDGNAYRVRAVYQPSGEPAEPVATAPLLMRYPFSASTILRREGDGWSEVEGARAGGTFELVAEVDRLGVFVAAGLPFHDPSDSRVTDILFAVGGLLVVVVGVLLGRRRSTVKKAEARRHAMGKKAKGPKPK